MFSPDETSTGTKTKQLLRVSRKRMTVINQFHSVFLSYVSDGERSSNLSSESSGLLSRVLS